MADRTIYLIPGFMSPAWMLFPLQRYLRSGLAADIHRWDYPRVFANVDQTIEALANRLDQHRQGTVTIVSHSFGDWIARSALRSMRGTSVRALVSVCPVVTSVAAAKLVTKIVGDIIPELSVMSNTQRSSIDIPDDKHVQRSFVWARGEVLVDRGDNLRIGTRQQTVLATHNSILFQPNAWKVIRDELVALA